MTEACKETYVVVLAPAIDSFTLLLKRIPCIYYLVQFKKDQVKVQALINSGNKVYIITPIYITKLDLKI